MEYLLRHRASLTAIEPGDGGSLAAKLYANRFVEQRAPSSSGSTFEIDLTPGFRVL